MLQTHFCAVVLNILCDQILNKIRANVSIFMGKPFFHNPIDLNFLDDILGLRLMLRFCTFITLICSASTSMALGLSDIALKSNLGESLDASVMVEDVESAPDATCFVVKEMSGESALKRINTRLVETNQKYQLYISTSVAVSEPIVNLTVSYACEPHIARSYVLLLDPAPLPLATTVPADTPSSKTATTSKPAVKPIENNTQDNRNVITNSTLDDGTGASENTSSSQNTGASEKKPVKKVSKKPRKPKASQNNQSQNSQAQNNLALNSNEQSADAKLMEAYVGKATNAKQTNNKPKKEAENTVPTSNPNPTSAKPYLVISGGALNGGPPYDASQTGLTLQLETQIDFNRAVEPPALPTSEETLDEVTVMANRLAHLEKQILSLQSTNLQLKAKVVEAENAGFKLSETQKHWLQSAGITLGILLLIALVEFARRQFLRHRLKRDEAIWFIGDASDADVSNDLDAGSDELGKFSAKAPNGDSIFNQTSNLPAQHVEPTIFNGASSPAAPAITNTQSATEQEVENVLDHADVFIAHGRTNLAIQLLQNHLEEFPTESPAVWLKLLGLLASENSESDYEVAVTECNQFFNIKLPSYAEALNEDESSIENHPHIVSRLEGVWGSQYAIGFLNDLIYNQQSQPREGFARNTFEELFFLRQISEILQNNFMPEGTTNVYRAESVQPALEKVAVNAAVFANVTPINSASSNINVQNEDALFDQPNDAVDSTQTLKPPANIAQEAELNIASFAAQDFNDEFNDAFKDGTYEAVDILLESDETDAAPLATKSYTTASMDASLDDDALPEIVFVSEAEQSLVENMHQTSVEHSVFDDAITEEIDFSNTGNETTDSGMKISELDALDVDALDASTLDISTQNIHENGLDSTIETLILEEDATDSDANTLAFDESAFKEISDAVKASMLEKSADELAEVDNSNMIEFDWDLPGAAETPSNVLKTSKKPSKK